jgi:hypothetical protein
MDVLSNPTFAWVSWDRPGQNSSSNDTRGWSMSNWLPLLGKWLRDRYVGVACYYSVFSTHYSATLPCDGHLINNEVIEPDNSLLSVWAAYYQCPITQSPPNDALDWIEIVTWFHRLFPIQRVNPCPEIIAIYIIVSSPQPYTLQPYFTAMIRLCTSLVTLEGWPVRVRVEARLQQLRTHSLVKWLVRRDWSTRGIAVLWLAEDYPIAVQFRDTWVTAVCLTIFAAAAFF